MALNETCVRCLVTAPAQNMTLKTTPARIEGAEVDDGGRLEVTTVRHVAWSCINSAACDARLAELPDIQKAFAERWDALAGEGT